MHVKVVDTSIVYRDQFPIQVDTLLLQNRISFKATCPITEAIGLSSYCPRAIKECAEARAKKALEIVAKDKGIEKEYDLNDSEY